MVVQPGEAASYWQPVPANGHADPALHPGNTRFDALSMGYQTIAPGGRVREHSHGDQVELQICFRGTGHVVVDGATHPLVPGTACMLGYDVKHELVNDGPDDLVMLMPHREGEGFPNRGDVGRRVGDQVVATYFDRAEIENGALDGRHLEICWIRDPIDALFIQIQGSARIRLEDGLLLRINYAAHNGFPFTPVGRILIDRNIIPREEMSMARIRKWMLANPEEAREARQTNRSFVFFRITGLGDEGEPAGGQGVRLTPGRSTSY